MVLRLIPSIWRRFWLICNFASGHPVNQLLPFTFTRHSLFHQLPLYGRLTYNFCTILLFISSSCSFEFSGFCAELIFLGSSTAGCGWEFQENKAAQPLPLIHMFSRCKPVVHKLHLAWWDVIDLNTIYVISFQKVWHFILDLRGNTGTAVSSWECAIKKEKKKESRLKRSAWVSHTKGITLCIVDSRNALCSSSIQQDFNILCINLERGRGIQLISFIPLLIPPLPMFNIFLVASACLPLL